MKKIFLLFLIINILPQIKAQLIHGTVHNKSDNAAIAFASVYINGTSIGTYSDTNGYFDLDITKYGTFPLTISALGYYTVTLTDFSKEKTVQILLEPKMFALHEVKVLAKSTARERKANLKLFRDQFLGPTYNGQNCVILNEEDISFNHTNICDTLIAYASKPIRIVNNALGYKITYYLDRFEYNKKSKTFLIKGSAFFNEDLSSGLTRKNFFDKRRKNAYLGSVNHFFTSLWTNSLNLNGFIVQNSKDEVLKYEEVVIVTNGRKYLAYNDNLYIYYYSKSPNSCIELIKDHIPFESNGYFDGSGLKIIGRMAQQRVGDLLPYDYNVH